MKLRLLIALLVSCASSCATVQLSVDERDALKTLRRFLQLDAAGARFVNGRGDTRQLVTWENEAGWNVAFVVSGWTISRPVLSAGHTTAMVRYEVEGLMQSDSFIFADTAGQDDAQFIEENCRVSFSLVKVGNEWRIESPILTPHVNFSTAKALQKELGHQNVIDTLADAEYIAKLKGARAGHCNCERLDF